jgi:hypothetical protein
MAPARFAGTGLTGFASSLAARVLLPCGTYIPAVGRGPGLYRNCNLWDLSADARGEGGANGALHERLCVCGDCPADARAGREVCDLNLTAGRRDRGIREEEV